MSDHVRITSSGGVLRITFTRPERLNALDTEMVAKTVAALDGAVGDDSVRVVAIGGEGGAFSAGADVGSADAADRLDGSSVDAANRLVRAVVRLDKPMVAIVDGVAAGVGCSLALACDLAIAAESARFVLAFTRIGLMPDGGATQTVAAAVGRTRAMRMALLAEPLTGAEAYAAGLVSHLVPDAELVDRVDAVLRQLAAGPPLAYAATKRAVNAAALGGLEDAMARERASQSLLLRTADAAEGIAAFADKRTPDFRGE